MNRILLLTMGLFLPLLAHAWPQDVPKVLSVQDEKTYRQLFQAQRALNTVKAQRLRQQVQNKLLLGHVAAERLLHPKTYSHYPDLKNWLAGYNDHPQAAAIYKLANSRAPAGASHKHPRTRHASLARYTDPNQHPIKIETDLDLSPANSDMAFKVRTHIRHLKRQENWLKAVDLLDTNAAPALLGPKNWAEMAVPVAWQLFRQGESQHAFSLMRRTARFPVPERPDALWLAGLAAWKVQDYDAAAKHFRALVFLTPKGSRAYTRAAWWAGRAYNALKRPMVGRTFHKMAANHPTTFYGQLAFSSMDKPLKINWKKPDYQPQTLQKLLQNPALKRIVALVQVGEYTLAQNELKHVYPHLPRGHDATLLALANRLHLPHAAMVLSLNLKAKTNQYYTGLYPVPHLWTPTDGYAADPALLLGVIRQESTFDPTIESRAGAKGLMQIMPRTANYIRGKMDETDIPRYYLIHPGLNLSLGQFYLNYLSDKHHGNIVHMLAAYNAGPGNLQKWLDDSHMNQDDPLLFIESIPFRETRNYVKKVLANYWMYKLRLQPDETNHPLRTALSRAMWPANMLALNSSRK
mgnify:CR=1 FL=1